MKKLMLLALAAVSALLVVPSFASATPAHVHNNGANPGNFTFNGGNATIARTDGVSTKGTSVSGTGTFENTTTGTVNLKIHGVTDSFGRTCASAGEPAGTVSVPGLRFHLLTESNTATILITPPATGDFATYVCGSGLFATTVTVKGNGIIGTITSPSCEGVSNTATLNFDPEEGNPGHQEHTVHTGVFYDLDSTLNGGSTSTTSIDADATITFAGNRTLDCT